MRLAWSAACSLLCLVLQLSVELFDASSSSVVGSNGIEGPMPPAALSLQPEPRGSCESVVDTAVPQSLVTPSLCERERRLCWKNLLLLDGDTRCSPEAANWLPMDATQVENGHALLLSCALGGKLESVRVFRLPTAD